MVEILFSQFFQLNGGKIHNFCWENSCLALEFHQSRLQCKQLANCKQSKGRLVGKFKLWQLWDIGASNGSFVQLAATPNLVFKCILEYLKCV